MKGCKKKPAWSDLKRLLAELDRPALLGLIQALYAASKNNQAFLYARFAMGEDYWNHTRSPSTDGSARM